MVLPDSASLDSYGSAKEDYSAPVDSSTDRPAAGTNPAYCDLAAMTHTSIRAFAAFIPQGSSAPTNPTSNAQDSQWNNGNANNAPPVTTRSSTGVYVTTWPSTVYDEIPASSAGSTPAGRVLNLRRTLAPNLALGGTTLYHAVSKVVPGFPNQVQTDIFAVGTSTHIDPNDGTVVSVFVL